MKKLFFNISLVVMALLGVAVLASCSDYFNPETDDELDGKKYISSSTEMYTGFLGIMTKLQAVGDKEILLTDTRADLLEPTTQSSADIIALYNYDKDLQETLRQPCRILRGHHRLQRLSGEDEGV